MKARAFRRKRKENNHRDEQAADNWNFLGRGAKRRGPVGPLFEYFGDFGDLGRAGGLGGGRVFHPVRMVRGRGLLGKRHSRQ